MEELFMQVLDRRDSVVAQMRQQVASYEQALACAALEAGLHPPPSLLPSLAAEPHQVNGRPSVPQFVFAGNRFTTPSSNRTAFGHPYVPSSYYRTVGVPSGYTIAKNVCDSVDTNQHRELQQKKTLVNQELAETSVEANMSLIQRSRSRQRNIQDRLREKDQGADVASSDGTQDRREKSRFGNVELNKTTVPSSSSSKPCGGGATYGGMSSSCQGQESDFHANQGNSIEVLKSSEEGSNGNQGVQLDRSDNNVKVTNNSPARDLLSLQVTDSVCYPLPKSHRLVEPKMLQFDGVESVRMESASEKVSQQLDCALESAHLDLVVVHTSDEDPSSSLDGVESGYLNPDSVPVKLHQECGNLDLTCMHSPNEDPSRTSSSEVSKSTSEPLPEKDTQCISEANSLERPCSKVSQLPEKDKSSILQTNCSDRSCNAVNLLLERDILYTMDDSQIIRTPDGFPDRVITQIYNPLEQQCSDSFLLPATYSRSLQIVDSNSGTPASSEILPDSLLDKDGHGHLSHSLINGADSQRSPYRSASSPEQLHPHSVNLGDICQPSNTYYGSQSNNEHSDDCVVVNASVSAEKELLARPSLELNKNFAGVDTPLSHTLGTHDEMFKGMTSSDLVNCHSGKLGDVQENSRALAQASGVSAGDKKNKCAVPKTESVISTIRTSVVHTTEKNSVTSGESSIGSLQQDGTEQDTSLFDNGVQINANSCTSENIKRMKSARPSVRYSLRSLASHEKINLLQSDGRSPHSDQKRSAADGVQVDDGSSSKRRKIMCQSGIALASSPHPDAIDDHMLAAANFTGKSQPSGCHFSRTSGSCEYMPPKSERRDAASNPNISVACGISGNAKSSPKTEEAACLSNVSLHNSSSAKAMPVSFSCGTSSRSKNVGRVSENSQVQSHNILDVETTTALPSCSNTVPDPEEPCTEEEYFTFQVQDHNATNSSVAHHQVSYALDQHCDHAYSPNALVHENLSIGSSAELGRKCKSNSLKGYLLSGAAITTEEGNESVDCDDTMPEFESFNVPVQFDSPGIEIRTHEALCDSRKLVTLSSNFSEKYDINTGSGVHQLLATISGKPTGYTFPDDVLEYSEDHDKSSKDTFGACGLALDDPFSISDAVASCSSNASSENPLTPSVEKYSLGKFSVRAGSSSEHMGSIPELACFRIDENSSIEEEMEYQDRSTDSVGTNYSLQWPSCRKALEDITGLCQNTGKSASLSTRFMDTGSMDLTAEICSSELNQHPNFQNDHDINKTKENPATSVKRVGKMSHSLNTRLSRTEMLHNRNGRHRSEANIDKQSKPTNVVANVASFIPLLKQKMQPTAACVKKDVKVKALEAAQAAKRLQEKKRNEREMRKAAAQVERERLKQERELKQKQEEELKKKHDADVATRKRQEEELKKKHDADVATRKRHREDGERREKERKRKCADEARKQQKQPMEKKHPVNDTKDGHQKASDNKDLRKKLADAVKNQVKPDDGTTEPVCGYKAIKSTDDKGVAKDERPASFQSHSKEIIPNSLDESYKMSPYKDSDEEDYDDWEHEEESRRRRKIIPSWARKENLDKILLSNQTLDPRVIFAQKCSFNLSDVLSVHTKRGFR